MLTQLQAETMLTLQAQMNAKVNPEWIKAAYPYLRAVVVEGAERWNITAGSGGRNRTATWRNCRWSSSTSGTSRCRTSCCENRGDHIEPLDRAARGVESAVASRLRWHALRNRRTGPRSARLELNIGLAAARRISIPLFAALLKDCGMEWKDLFCQYVGKNVLNFFRQDNGYKQGTYRKLWGGREDNEHLVEIMGTLNSEESTFQHQLYSNLKDRYSTLG